MQSTMKPHKQMNKVNKKKKQIRESSTGELTHVNSSKRFPIIALPEIVTTPSLLTYRRFVNNAGAVSGFISIQDLLNQFTFATTTVLVFPYVRAVRLKKIRVLAPVQTQGTSVTLTITPAATDNSGNSFNCVPETYTDTSASIDVPAYISLTPSLDTPLGAWHFNTTVNQSLMVLTAPQGSTMDILFEYILTANNANAPAYTRVVAAATPGCMYAAAILTNFNPVGVNSI